MATNLKVAIAAANTALAALAVKPGLWKYRWEASAPFTGVVEGSFSVAPTSFPAD